MGKSLDQLDIVLNPDIKHWEHLIGWITKTEGWMFHVEDYTTWLTTFEKFWYFFAIDKETQEAVAGLSMSYERSASGEEDEDVYCLGMYYVKPDWRNSGIGCMLFDKLMAIAGDANIALHGVLKMSPKYAAKYGFNKMPNYKHDFASITTEHLVLPKQDNEHTIKDLEKIEEAKIIAYDVGISHRSRAKYLLKFLTTGQCYVKVALNSAEEIVGICCIRVVITNDLSIGPFYANNAAAARSVLAATLASIPDIKKHKNLYFLYPAINREARNLFEAISGGHAKIQPFTQCAFTKKLIPTADEKVFGMIECASSLA
ncbi:hypothetical protein RB195_015082 [Necator americanus]|uniref:N-acetyltransferase domain-containing protein n=1 Tax=Necator americanus TaxID=51031 RepID=A0ABR1E2W4_NECAM